MSLSLNSISLNPRQQQVLRATVQRYIATAEPVGSEVLAKEYNLSVSSATIRNAMGFLERAGLLYQPHTSAGRVPSDSGYRIYVDQLLPPPELNYSVEKLRAQQSAWGGWSFEAVLKGAAQILASLSGCITLITLPMARTLELRHVQLVQVSADRAMLIVVTDTYETQSTLLDLPADPAHDLAEPRDPDQLTRELQILSNFLSEHLRGKALADLATLDWSELGQEFQRYGTLLSSVARDLDRRLSQTHLPTQMMISGVADVMRQPEFSLQQLQLILQLLEGEQEQLVPLMFEPSDGLGRRVNIRIGAENPLAPIQACSLISTPYQRGDLPIGSVGILGPTRMDYENAIALIEATADYLSDRLS
jgi:heat-inducible transcriptional repressor